MVVQNVRFNLKNGTPAIIGFTTSAESAIFLEYLRQVSRETPYLGRCAADYDSFDLSYASRWLDEANIDQNRAVLICWVGGRIVGLGEIEFFGWRMTRHRSRVEVSVLKEFWNQGIASKMFEVMISIAEQQTAVKQIELGYFEGNDRGRALYEKFGFRTVSVVPDALRLDDGTLLNEHIMMLKI